MHSTNYFNTLIEIAEDSPINQGEMPPLKGENRSAANIQFDMLYGPYQHSSDDVLFAAVALRKDYPENEWKEEREAYFSKSQPCFRASPLTKRYGWGVHSNEEGKIAIYGSESKEYQDLQSDPNVEKVKAMRSKRG